MRLLAHTSMDLEAEAEEEVGSGYTPYHPPSDDLLPPGRPCFLNVPPSPKMAPPVEDKAFRHFTFKL